MWATRIQLEALSHPQGSSFVTLTYSDENLPENNSLNSLHWREFTKYLGHRYFGVGEYGDRTLRPHYHLVIFGLPTSTDSQKAIEERWGKGRTQSVPLSPQLAHYVAGYTTKKLTRMGDPRLAPGQLPEFARMSRRPALGSGVVGYLASLNLRDRSTVQTNLDVVSAVHLDGKPVPIGRTLHAKVRAAVSLPDAWKHNRGFRAVDYAVKLQQYPELIEDKEVKRITQAERATNLRNLKIKL